MSENEKLKFRDEESVNGEIAEISDPLPVVEAPADELPADHDGGGDEPGEDTDENNISDSEADITDEVTESAETLNSKLYERESSLQFAKEDKKIEAPKSKPDTKRKKIFGVTGESTDGTTADTPEKYDTPTDNSADISELEAAAVAELADGIKSKPYERKETPDTDIIKNNTNNTDPAVQIPTPPNVAVTPAPAVAPAGKSVKLVKPVRPQKSKLKFSKGEKPKTKKDKQKFKEDKRIAKQDDKIGELEYKTELNVYKRDKARAKQPTVKKKVKVRYYDEEKKTVKTKLQFEEEVIPINEAKWNLPKKQAFPVKSVAALTTVGINKLHTKVYQVEHENVGTQAAHQTELVGESAFRGSKKLIHSAHRYVKNTPYRQAAKYETKAIESRIKLDYQKAVKENPKLKSSVMSRFMQKRKIKRQYAESLRQARKSGETLKKTGNILTKTAQAVTNTIRRNPVFILKIGLLLLIIFAVWR